MLQHYATDLGNSERPITLHAFSNETERDRFVDARWPNCHATSGNWALRDYLDLGVMYLHGESRVPDYWREHVASDVEPTTDPGTYRAFADLAHNDV